MKSALLLSFFIAATTSAAPIEITCGNLQTGNAVVFSISPLKRTVQFKTYLDSVLRDLVVFAPTHGIYDTAHVDFSGRDFLDSDVYIHASFTQFLRINHVAAMTIALQKKHDETGYRLTNFTSGYVITSGDNVNELPHPALIGLPCIVSGL